MPADIRKLIVQVDETRREMGRDVDPPTRRALAIAVIGALGISVLLSLVATPVVYYVLRRAKKNPPLNLGKNGGL